MVEDVKMETGMDDFYGFMPLLGPAYLVGRAVGRAVDNWKEKKESKKGEAYGEAESSGSSYRNDFLDDVRRQRTDFLDDSNKQRDAFLSDSNRQRDAFLSYANGQRDAFLSYANGKKRESPKGKSGDSKDSYESSSASKNLSRESKGNSRTSERNGKDANYESGHSRGENGSSSYDVGSDSKEVSYEAVFGDNADESKVFGDLRNCEEESGDLEKRSGKRKPSKKSSGNSGSNYSGQDDVSGDSGVVYKTAEDLLKDWLGEDYEIGKEEALRKQKENGLEAKVVGEGDAKEINGIRRSDYDSFEEFRSAVRGRRDSLGLDDIDYLVSDAKVEGMDYITFLEKVRRPLLEDDYLDFRNEAILQYGLGNFNDAENVVLKEIVEEADGNYSEFIRLVNNPEKRFPFLKNVVLREGGRVTAFDFEERYANLMVERLDAVK